MEEIKKKALFYLGNNYLELDEETKQKVDDIYEPTLEKALTKHTWSFATETAELQTTLIENNKYKYKANVPDDFLALINIYANIGETSFIEDYRRKNKIIYTNNNKVFLKYTQRLEEKDFPNHFKDYLEYELASELCYNLTGDVELLQVIEAKRLEEYEISTNIEDKQRKPFNFLQYPFNSIRR